MNSDNQDKSNQEPNGSRRGEHSDDIFPQARILRLDGLGSFTTKSVLGGKAEPILGDLLRSRFRFEGQQIDPDAPAALQNLIRKEETIAVLSDRIIAFAADVVKDFESADDSSKIDEYFEGIFTARQLLEKMFESTPTTFSCSTAYLCKLVEIAMERLRVPKLFGGGKYLYFLSYIHYTEEQKLLIQAKLAHVMAQDDFDTAK